jgi:hypothetical protein
VRQFGTSTITGRIHTSSLAATGAYISENGISIPIDDYGVDFADNMDLSMRAQLFDYSDFSHPFLIASTSIRATLLNSPNANGDYFIPTFSTSYPATNTLDGDTVPLGSIENPTLNLPNGCDPGETLNLLHPETIRCVALNTINELIASTAAFGNGTLESARQKLNLIFPLNIFNRIKEDITAAQASSTPAGITISQRGEVFKGYDNVVLLSNTTVDDITDDMDFPFKDLLDKIMYTMTGIYIIALGFTAVRTMRYASQGNNA